MLFGTVLAWIGLGVVLFRIDPTAGGVFRFFLFYASLAAAITGTVTMAGYTIRWKRNTDPVMVRVITTSFRQGAWLAILMVGLLMLQGVRWLRWWNALLLVLALAGLEVWRVWGARSAVPSKNSET